MRRVVSVTTVFLLVLAGPPGLQAEQNILKNGSLESGPGSSGINESKAAGWTFFGGSTVERSTEANYEPGGAGHSLKVFGGETTVGAYQNVPTTAGKSITIAAFLYTRSNDKIGGDASARIKLEFYDGADQPVGTAEELVVLDGNSPADTWIPAAIGPITAPSGTATARMTCVFTFTNTSSGSAYWDACELTIDGGANALTNGDFEEAGLNDGGVNQFGIDNWAGFGEQYKSEDIAAVHGDFTANVRTGGDFGAGFSGLYQDTQELKAGDRIFWHAWVWNPSAGGLTDTAAAAIKLEFQPGEGKETPPAEELLSFDQDEPVDEWVQITYTTTVPNDITLARVVMIANDTSTTNGPIYFDLAEAERSSAPGVNQLQNASFESGSSGTNGLTNWTEFRGSQCRARKNVFEVPALDGDAVLKISGSCVAGIYQEVEVQPGEELTISAWLYTTSTDPFNDEDGPAAGVKVEWRAGGIPNQIDIGGAPNNSIFQDAPKDEWLPIWIDYTMPAGSAAKIRCTFIVGRYGASAAQVYFDAGEAVVLNKFDGGDVDGDSDEDLLDFAWFQYAFSGDGGTPLKFNGITFDHDQDDDVDLTDYNFFAPRLDGPR